MSTKNIILIIVCIVCAYFVFIKFYKFINPGSPTFDQELVRCDIIKDWLKKKNINEIAIYGITETLSLRLEKNGIRVNSGIVTNPEKKLGAFFNEVKTSGVKTIVFSDALKATDSTEELQKYLKSGGTIYFRSYANELNDNEVLFQAVYDAMKKGHVCVVLDRFAEGDVRKLSMRDRVLAENLFIDDSNAIEFENWHKKMVKLKAEFQNQQPPH